MFCANVSGTYTITLRTPSASTGGSFLLYMDVSFGAGTLSSPSGNWGGATGTGAGLAQALNRAHASSYRLDSDGTNWNITAMPTIDKFGRLSASTMNLGCSDLATTLTVKLNPRTSLLP